MSKPKLKWYLSGWFIFLMFLLTPLIIPFFIAIVLLVIRSKETNKFFKSQLEESGFKIDKTIRVMTSTFYFDDSNKKWAYKKSNSSPIQIYNYSDLLDFEIFENGDSVMKGKAGGAIIGGLTFGVVGAIVGSSGKRKTSNTCNTLQVRITINDLQSPQIVIPIISYEVKKNSIIYKNAIETAKSLTSSLTYVQKQTA